MKKFLLSISTLFLMTAMLTSCHPTVPSETDTSVPETTVTSDKPVSVAEVKPTTDDELFDYIISKWKAEETEDLYEYADAEVTALMQREDFVYLFDSISAIGGPLQSVTNQNAVAAEGKITYTATLTFENVDVDLTISFRNMKICAFLRDIHFKNTFEIRHDGGIVERYFILENDGNRLNAVYTYVDDGASHPAALLIAGSGPSDYNETVGILTPFEDIALGLARNGIHSLRVDKRTFHEKSDFDATSGIGEEYIRDCNAAMAFLRSQKISELYLLGHSLGGQIAAELAVDDDEVDGIILFNSSARHLADIACDQYAAMDPANRSAYIAYAEAAKKATEATAHGAYYYGATDHYWSSYNQIDTIRNIQDAGKRTLIINSTFDRQIFDADIELWKSRFSDNATVSIRIFDDLSHFGYRIDTADPAAIYRRTVFPSELIEEFSRFIRGASEA